MNLRLACAWIREQMISRAQHRIAVGPERATEEDRIHDQAVAEVDEFLEPALEDDGAPDVWSDPVWVAAMGGEMSGGWTP